MKTWEDHKWDNEVETVRVQLLRLGVPPWDAVGKAVKIVRDRRMAAAKLDEVPDDVRRAASC